MAVRVGVNGFGRIGRNFLRAMLANPSAGVELVAVNDPGGDASTLAHLLKYDTIHGVLPEEVSATEDTISAGKTTFKKFSETDPSKIAWDEVGAQVVIESTGRFLVRDAAAQHLKSGAKKVVISAPSPDADATICVGVNDEAYDPLRDDVISNASCTTNCLAPMVRVLQDSFGVEQGFITTVHAYTSDQSLQDLAHPSRSGKADLRRMRAAAESIIPSSTGAAKAIGLVVPELKGKLDGLAMRVPVPDGSITDLVAVLSKPATVAEVNDAYRRAASEQRWKGILQYGETPLVSTDIVGNPHSCVFSAHDTMVSGSMVKLLGWYDNEWGFSNRLVDLCALLGKAGL